MIQLNPAGHGPPPWNDQLPPGIRLNEPPIDLEDRVRTALAAAGLYLHGFWEFNVPEWFDDPRELYMRLTWGSDPQSTPGFDEVRESIEAVFARHAGPRGLVIPHERFLWKAVRDPL